jgi:hypothetical protein
MKCPKCGQDVELQKRPVGTDEDGNPILNEFAICRSCKKKWNLDKQRQKKSAEAAAAGSAAKSDTPAKKAAPARKPVSDKATPEKSAPEKASRPVKASSAEKNPPAEKRPRRTSTGSKTASDTETRLGNIPSENVRKKREAAVKKNYEDMLNTDKGKSRPAKKKRLDDDFSTPEQAKSGPRLVSKGGKTVPSSSRQEEEVSYTPVARFGLLRLFLGLISILGAAFFIYKAVNARLDDIASGGTVKTALTYAVLAGCLLLSGIITLIMRRRVTRVSFFLPLLLCAGGAVFTFLKKQDEKFLFYGFIAAAVLAAIYLLLTLLGGEKIDDEDEFYDDDFDDEY